MLKIFKYIKQKEWLQVLVIFILSILMVWFNLKYPDYMVRITTLVQTEGSPIGEIWAAGGMMLLCMLGSLACTIAVSFFAVRTATALATRLRGLLFSKVRSFSMEEISRFSTSSLITRCTNDITQLQSFFASALQLLLRVPILLVGGIIKIAGKGSEWTLATVIALLILLALLTVVMVIVMPQFKKMQTFVDRLNLTVKESLTGRHVIRAYNAKAYQEKKFETANSAFTKADQTTNSAMASFMPLMGMALNGVTIAVYYIGAYLISSAGQTEALTLFSNMVVFSAYVGQLLSAVKFIVKVLPRYPRAAASARRVNEVLETEPNIKDGNLTNGLAGQEGKVAFEHVSFRYPGAAAYVLEDISFTANHGETVAFIGSTGSGKSTLVNLAMRFFDATEGEVLIGGINVRDYKLEALSQKIGYVPQTAVLFKGTVGSNIAYGDNLKDGYDDGIMQKAARVAQAEEFIDNFEDGYDAPIAQRGSNVSGGQKQRLSIARAVCRRPEIYIFDDSFSALDYKTDRTLRSALKKESAGVTSLIVAQRIGTIMDADRIIVLDEGKIVGQGTHRELLNSCRVYKEIAMSQLSEEELGA